MMKSVILKAPSRVILQIMVVFSLFMLLRGHNHPGGGFIGGLIAACALALFHISQGDDPIRRPLFTQWPWLLSLGVLCLAISLIWPAITNAVPFEGLWLNLPLFKTVLHLGTPFIFDLGIYFLVIGSVAVMIDVLER